MLRFDKSINLSFLLKSILSVSLSNRMWGSDVRIRCFTIFRIQEYCIHFYIIPLFIILQYTFLVISFDRYKEYMICLISLSKFLDVLPAFTCVKAIGDLWNIYIGDNILSLE